MDSRGLPKPESVRSVSASSQGDQYGKSSAEVGSVEVFSSVVALRTAAFMHQTHALCVLKGAFSHVLPRKGKN